MTCNNLCTLKYGGIKRNGEFQNHGKSLYHVGYLYCSKCGFFMTQWRPTFHCACCGSKLRSKPFYARHRLGTSQIAKQWDEVRDKTRY